MGRYDTDVLIVGSGVAGLYSALSIDKNIRVTIVTKEKAEDSNSYLAQGGMSVLRDEEDFNSYREDTLRAGHYENRLSSVDIMIENSRDILDKLTEYGVDWDRNGDDISYTREGGHSVNRIVHNKDQTGKEILNRLIDRIKEQDNIELIEDFRMVDLIVKNNRNYGIVGINKGEIRKIYAKTTILATGGVGGLYKNTTNFQHINGEGIALALAYGAKMKDLSYVQFHPTTLYDENLGRKNLLTEALRGEGAYIINSKGERFLNELMPRDKVTYEIKKVMREENLNNVYLTMDHLEEEKIKKRFPHIVEICREKGFKLWEDNIPIVPSQHYYMGGIDVDENSKTSIERLFAVGECSCNGVHGKNRLASNSLLESMVFAKMAAKYINENIGSFKIDYKDSEEKDLNLWIKNSRESLKREIGVDYEAI